MYINVDDIELQKNENFQNFLKENPGRGYVKVRASIASEALPVSGVEVTVTKKIGDYIVEFFKGQTDESGMINGIILPTPGGKKDNLEAPSFTQYELKAVYKKENMDKIYILSLCCNASVVQYITIIPNAMEKNI